MEKRGSASPGRPELVEWNDVVLDRGKQPATVAESANFFSMIIRSILGNFFESNGCKDVTTGRKKGENDR